jgi:L-amino acid N-acyltransferase YncA
MRAIRGYYLFSLEKNGKMIAYCFLKKNYLSKYPFMEKNDLIVNPYFVCEECRGRKLGEKIVKAALNNMPTDTENVWAIVLNDNIPSIKTLQRIGFELEGYSHVVNSSHHIQQEPTDKLVFKYHVE